jgi:hypothetical protein
MSDTGLRGHEGKFFQYQTLVHDMESCMSEEHNKSFFYIHDFTVYKYSSIVHLRCVLKYILLTVFITDFVLNVTLSAATSHVTVSHQLSNVCF